jgi:hypothetical protein
MREVTVKLPKSAKVKVAFFNVHCPECGETIAVPESNFGRHMWLKGELDNQQQSLYCTNMGRCTIAQQQEPLIIPPVAAVVTTVSVVG